MVKKKSGEHHEVKHEEVSTKKKRPCKILWEKLSNNYWMTASIVLALVLIVSLLVNIPTSSNKIGEQAVAFLNNQTGGGVTLVSVENNKTFYTVTVGYQGQNIPVYISSDGKNLFQGLMPMTKVKTTTSSSSSTQTQTNAPKSDVPQVELYIWSYCPYGVQAQGPMAEVAKLLSDSAEFKVVPYYDGHGAYETQQNKIQSCIQELSGDKYWDYAAGFVKTIYSKCGSSRDAECDKTESISLMKSLKIDSTAIMSCVDKKGESLNNAASQKASQNGVQGSPTIIINGAKVNVARNAESIKTAICSAFNNAPAECSQQLDSSAAAAAGNC
jgi:protein-disulfide isomerase